MAEFHKSAFYQWPCDIDVILYALILKGIDSEYQDGDDIKIFAQT